MKKFSVIFLILFLVLFTAFIKNSTKRIDDQIFTTKENIRSFKKNLENIKLEYDYLSSAEKLLEFQNNFFEDKLIKKDIHNIMVIDSNRNHLEIKKLKITNEK